MADIVADVGATGLGDKTPRDGDMKKNIKNAGRGGKKGDKRGSRAECVDNEAPLLALAQRVPMRQVSLS